MVKKIILMAAMLACPLFANAHNHPKWMTGTAKTDALSNTINPKSLAFAIDKYIKEEVKLRGGKFSFYDPLENSGLALDLINVHNDKLCFMGGDQYFACADFKNIDGSEYDLDVLMRGKTAKDLKVTSVMLHKAKGKLRYDWAEKNGIWMKVPVTEDSKDQDL